MSGGRSIGGPGMATTLLGVSGLTKIMSQEWVLYDADVGEPEAVGGGTEGRGSSARAPAGGLEEVVRELRAVREALGRDKEDEGAAPNHRMTKIEVAQWLGVSTRWVERHLTPSERVRGGKSWYLRDEVERQLEHLKPPSRQQRAERTQRKRRRAGRTALDSRPDSAFHTRVAELEERLRQGGSPP